MKALLCLIVLLKLNYLCDISPFSIQYSYNLGHMLIIVGSNCLFQFVFFSVAFSFLVFVIAMATETMVKIEEVFFIGPENECVKQEVSYSCRVKMSVLETIGINGLHRGRSYNGVGCKRGCHAVKYTQSSVTAGA